MFPAEEASSRLRLLLRFLLCLLLSRSICNLLSVSADSLRHLSGAHVLSPKPRRKTRVRRAKIRHRLRQTDYEITYEQNNLSSLPVHSVVLAVA